MVANFEKTLANLMERDLEKIEQEQRRVKGIHSHIQANIEEAAQLSGMDAGYVLQLAGRIALFTSKPWYEVAGILHLFFLYQEYDRKEAVVKER